VKLNKYISVLALTTLASCSNDGTSLSTGDYFTKPFSQKEKGLLSSPFGGKTNTNSKYKALHGGFTSKIKSGTKSSNTLPDFYSVSIKRTAERGQLPSGFGRKVSAPKKKSEQKDHFSTKSRRSDRSELDDHFAKGKSNHERGELADHFTKTNSNKNRESLADHFGTADDQRERLDSPDHFAQDNHKGQQNELADHFSKSSSKKGHEPLSDHFSSKRSDQERSEFTDHFAAKKSNKEHTDKELYSKGSQRKIWRKNFVGQKFALFNKDPNASRKKRVAQRKKNFTWDPFGSKKRKANQPQMPRGEGDLFPRGVGPRLEDLR
jgi:hypothetical protein